MFAIVDDETGDFLGGCAVFDIHPRHRFANIAYWVRASRRRCGVATEALRQVARFGTEAIALPRVEVLAAVENIASQRVAERAGARREGILRNRITLNERVYDAVMYSFVP